MFIYNKSRIKNFKAAIDVFEDSSYYFILYSDFKRIHNYQQSTADLK